MELIDKASKLLTLSDMKVVIPATEIVTTLLQAGKTKGKTKFNDDSFLAIPAGKKIKVEPQKFIVKVEQDVKGANIEEKQDVWATFHSTRIRLLVEDKLMNENGQRLNYRHINFVKAILRTQFSHYDGLQNTYLQNRLRWSATCKVVYIRSDHWVVVLNLFLLSKNNVRMYETVFNEWMIQQCLC